MIEIYTSRGKSFPTEALALSFKAEIALSPSIKNIFVCKIYDDKNFKPAEGVIGSICQRVLVGFHVNYEEEISAIEKRVNQAG